jgi:hypothetical protein
MAKGCDIIYRNDANLAIYPSPDQIIKYDGATITLGDLDGNFLKALWMLAWQGVIQMDAATYDELRYLYIFSADLYQVQYARINELLTKITVTKGSNLRLLGDETADRGINDLLTLRLLELLKNGGCNYQILLSNHGACFLAEFRKDPREWKIYMLKGDIQNPEPAPEQARSLLGLQRAIQDGIVTHTEVKGSSPDIGQRY